MSVTLRFTSIMLIVTGLFVGSFLLPKQAMAGAIGGRFLPGLFDIFTPTIACGLQVSVLKTDGTIGIYTWVPTLIYDYFYYAISHIGNSMLGTTTDFPTGICPPTLYLTGSSIAP